MSVVESLKMGCVVWADSTGQGSSLQSQCCRQVWRLNMSKEKTVMLRW